MAELKVLTIHDRKTGYCIFEVTRDGLGVWRLYDGERKQLKKSRDHREIMAALEKRKKCSKYFQ